MVDSEKIKNHNEHLAKLIKNAESNTFDSIKDLVDYLTLFKGSSFTDLILRKGVSLVMKHPSQITLDSKFFQRV